MRSSAGGQGGKGVVGTIIALSFLGNRSSNESLELQRKLYSCRVTGSSNRVSITLPGLLTALPHCRIISSLSVIPLRINFVFSFVTWSVVISINMAGLSSRLLPSIWYKSSMWGTERRCLSLSPINSCVSTIEVSGLRGIQHLHSRKSARHWEAS